MVDTTTGTTKHFSKNLYLSEKSKNLLKKRVRDNAEAPQNGLIHRSIFDDESNIAKSSGVFPNRKKARIAPMKNAAGRFSAPLFSYQNLQQRVPVPIVQNIEEQTEKLITDMLMIDDTFAGLTDLMPMVPREILPRPETEGGIMQMKGEGLLAPLTENAESLSPCATALAKNESSYEDQADEGAVQSKPSPHRKAPYEASQRLADPFEGRDPDVGAESSQRQGIRPRVGHRLHQEYACDHENDLESPQPRKYAGEVVLHVARAVPKRHGGAAAQDKSGHVHEAHDG